MGKKATRRQDLPEPEGPARILPSHIQDREISTVAGAPRAFRKLDGLAWMEQRKEISRLQVEAGRRLQWDYAISKREDIAKGGGERTDGHSSYDIPQAAHDAGRRVKAAMAVLPPELVSIMTMFLLPDFERDDGISNEKIAARVREDKRAMPLAIRIGLSLLARHYGG